MFFYEVGYELGTEGESYSSELGLEKIRNYADLYGLTETTGIEIEESAPTVSTEDAVRSAIGQGTNNFSTVGLARYVKTIANNGTCYYNDLGVKVAGKTGTAEENKNRGNHALFVCYAPYEQPEIAVATRIAYGYTSTYAARMTKEVLKYYFDLAEEDEVITGTASQITGVIEAND